MSFAMFKMPAYDPIGIVIIGFGIRLIKWDGKISANLSPGA